MFLSKNDTILIHLRKTHITDLHARESVLDYMMLLYKKKSFLLLSYDGQANLPYN